MANIALLKPKPQDLCRLLITECKNRINQDIAIIQTLRTVKEQNALYAQGRTTPGEIVTHARGGYSMHHYGVAFDICPLVNGKLDWNNIPLFEKIGPIGESIGLEWGGHWKTIIDRPHYQYAAGYDIEDFRTEKVDWKKFDSAPINTPIPPIKTLKVTSKNGLNIRKGPGTEFAVIGKLLYGAVILPLEQKNGWVKIHYGNDFGYISASFLTAS